MSTSSISLPLGTKAFAKSLMAWTMLTSFKDKRQSEDALGQTSFKYSLKHWGAYLGFLVTYHSCPPLAGRQIEIHGVPTDSSFEPEGGESGWATVTSNIHIITGCMETLLMVDKSLEIDYCGLDYQTACWSLAQTDFAATKKGGWPTSRFQVLSIIRHIWLAPFDYFINPVRRDLLIWSSLSVKRRCKNRRCQQNVYLRNQLLGFLSK